MELSPSSEAANCAATQELPRNNNNNNNNNNNLYWRYNPAWVLATFMVCGVDSPTHNPNLEDHGLHIVWSPFLTSQHSSPGQRARKPPLHGKR
jgi:hypothetical protein